MRVCVGWGCGWRKRTLTSSDKLHMTGFHAEFYSVEDLFSSFLIVLSVVLLFCGFYFENPNIPLELLESLVLGLRNKNKKILLPFPTAEGSFTRVTKKTEYTRKEFSFEGL